MPSCSEVSDDKNEKKKKLTLVEVEKLRDGIDWEHRDNDPKLEKLLTRNEAPMVN